MNTRARVMMSFTLKKSNRTSEGTTQRKSENNPKTSQVKLLCLRPEAKTEGGERGVTGGREVEVRLEGEGT